MEIILKTAEEIKGFISTLTPEQVTALSESRAHVNQLESIIESMNRTLDDRNRGLDLYIERLEAEEKLRLQLDNEIGALKKNLGKAVLVILALILVILLK